MITQQVVYSVAHRPRWLHLLPSSQELAQVGLGQSRRAAGPARHHAEDESLLTGRTGQVIIGDKGYYGRDFEAVLAAASITLPKGAAAAHHALASV
jgi:hypothetical protein